MFFSEQFILQWGVSCKTILILNTWRLYLQPDSTVVLYFRRDPLRSVFYFVLFDPLCCQSSCSPVSMEAERGVVSTRMVQEGRLEVLVWRRQAAGVTRQWLVDMRWMYRVADQLGPVEWFEARRAHYQVLWPGYLRQWSDSGQPFVTLRR